MTDDQLAFEKRVTEMCKMVHPDHAAAFKFIFEHGKGFIDPVQAGYVALITALAINDSVRRQAAEDKRNRKLIV